MGKIIICLTTVEKKEEGEEIAKTLLEERLAGCVSITEVFSSYRWKGKIEKSKEFLLIIKTREEAKERVEKRIKEIHSYSVPEIIFIEGEASSSYFSWLMEEVKD